MSAFITLRDPVGDLTTVSWAIPDLTAGRIRRLLWHACYNADNGKMFIGGERVRHSRYWRSAGQPAAHAAPHLAYGRLVQTTSRDLFTTLVEALSPHLARWGLPAGATDVEVFSGDYTTTPGGIHREACSNVHLVVAGTKTMHFWTDPRFARTASARTEKAAGAGTQEQYLTGCDAADHLAEATSLTATGGGGFCWGSGTWHVAQTHGDSMALNIALYDRALDEPSRLPLWSHTFDAEVPSDWLRDYGYHIGVADTGRALARLSALGMRPAPANRPRGAAGVVRRARAVPLLWVRSGDHGWLAVLGAALRVSWSVAMARFLHALSGPGEVAVPQACGEASSWLCRQGVAYGEGGR